MSLSALIISTIAIVPTILNLSASRAFPRHSKGEHHVKKGTHRNRNGRDKQGQFKESVDVGRSLSADQRHKAEHEAKPGRATKATASPSEIASYNVNGVKTCSIEAMQAPSRTTP